MSVEQPSPTIFEHLDLDPRCFALPDDSEAIYLGKGFNSHVVRAGSHVLKVSKSVSDPESAVEYASLLQDEQAMLEPHVGDNLPPTMYIAAASEKWPDKARVVTVQPFISGLTLAEYMKQPEPDTGALKEFLWGCMRMYRDTGQIADVANIETRFNVFKTRNLVIPTEGPDTNKPILVDTNFGKIQRSNRLGPLWRKKIMVGVNGALTKLGATGF